MSVLSSLVKQTGKNLSNDGSALSKLTQVNNGGIAQKVRDGWFNAGDIDGIMDGKFLDTSPGFFENTFDRSALDLSQYTPEQLTDRNKVAGLVRAIKNNEDIAPIAGFKNDDGMIGVYDGHHRLAAYQKAGKIPRVKIFDRSAKDEAYNYADEWAKNAVKRVQSYLPAKPEAGLDEYGMGAINLRDMDAPKAQQSLADV